MTIWYNCFMSVLTLFLDILSLFNSLIGCSWIAPLTPVVVVMRGAPKVLWTISFCEILL